MIIKGRGIFLDIRNFRFNLSNLERQVCLLRFGGAGGTGMQTGFLIAPDVIMTMGFFEDSSQSKISSDLNGEGVTAIFDYVASESGKINPGSSYSLSKSNWLIDSEPEKDNGLGYALLRLRHPAGRDKLENGNIRGWIDLTGNNPPPERNSPLVIVHHPAGLPLKFSINTEAVDGLGDSDNRLYYITDTQAGSGGAPCFDLDLNIVAVHLGRGTFDKTISGSFSNMGIPISKIIDRVRTKGFGDIINKKPPYKPQTLNIKTMLYAGDFPLDEELRELIRKGESQRVEFKQTASLNPLSKTKDGSARSAIVETVASFMNSADGGILFIGIDDNGTIVGINKEYSIADPQKANWDGYLLFLNNLLRETLDAKSPYNLYQIERYTEEELDLCCISVRPADDPVYYRDDLFIRDMAQSRKLKGRAVQDYIKTRWNK